MKGQALFSSKDKSRKIKVSSSAILLGALRVNIHACTLYIITYKQLYLGD